MTTETLVMTALKETAPALHRQLTASGELNQFVQELANAIRERIRSILPDPVGVFIATSPATCPPP